MVRGYCRSARDGWLKESSALYFGPSVFNDVVTFFWLNDNIFAKEKQPPQYEFE